jgi:membrane-bound serine protease (ClpP class)
VSGARRIRILALAALAATGGAMLAADAAGQQGERFVYSLELSGEISPATAGWVDEALDEAVDQGAEAAIIRLDTPGGLDSSTREMVKDIIAAPIPVIAYVSPDGARAASAGLFIVEASDVAAMAPQTNIGSATPISIGPGSDDEVLGRKIENDAAAYIRALASAHGRNAEAAEASVIEAENLTAREALEAELIDAVAASEQALLAELDGFEVRGPKAQRLNTGGLAIERHDMPFLYEVLQIIVNPTIAFLLLSAGLLGLAIEIFSPGLIFPGTFGLISFLLGLYGTSQLPVTAAGILLLVLAVGLIVAEAHLSTSGVLGAGGIVALIFGGLLLFNSDEGADVSAPAVIAAGLLLGGLLAFAVDRVVKSRREPVRTGYEEMVGAVGEVRTPLTPEGQVFVEGALWRARLGDGEGRAALGDRVRVEAVEGLTLLVRPARQEPAVETDSEEGAS